jgi:hypothetical protein
LLEWALVVYAGSLAATAALFSLEMRRWFDEGVRLSVAVMVDAQFYEGRLKIKHVCRYHGEQSRQRSSYADTYGPLELSNLARLPPSRPPQRCLKRHLPKTMIVPNPIGQQQLSHVSEPGRYWIGMVQQTPEPEEMIKGGRLYVGVIGSHKNKPSLKPVERIWSVEEKPNS